MKVLGSFLAFVLCGAITLPFGYAHAGDSAYVVGGPMYCKSVGDGPLYFSGIFVMKTGTEGIDNAFTQELIEKYGFKGSTSCAWANAQTPVENVRQDIQQTAPGAQRWALPRRAPR